MRPVGEAGVWRTSLDNGEAFLQALNEVAANPEVRGIAIARGGGGGLEAIGSSAEIVRQLINLGLPFYVAIGHSRDLFLIDKYADQIFHTPSALGAGIADALREKLYREARSVHPFHDLDDPGTLGGAVWGEGGMKTYRVTVPVIGSVTRDVKAESLEDAYKTALATPLTISSIDPEVSVRCTQIEPMTTIDDTRICFAPVWSITAEELAEDEPDLSESE